jgi:hypothetical protein
VLVKKISTVGNNKTNDDNILEAEKWSAMTALPMILDDNWWCNYQLCSIPAVTYQWSYKWHHIHRKIRHCPCCTHRWYVNYVWREWSQSESPKCLTPTDESARCQSQDHHYRHLGKCLQHKDQRLWLEWSSCLKGQIQSKIISCLVTSVNRLLG